MSHIKTTHTVSKKTKNFIGYVSTAPKMDHVYSNIKLGGAANVHHSMTLFESRLRKSSIKLITILNKK